MYQPAAPRPAAAVGTTRSIGTAALQPAAGGYPTATGAPTASLANPYRVQPSAPSTAAAPRAPIYTSPGAPAPGAPAPGARIYTTPGPTGSVGSGGYSQVCAGADRDFKAASWVKDKLNVAVQSRSNSDNYEIPYSEGLTLTAIAKMSQIQGSLINWSIRPGEAQGLVVIHGNRLIENDQWDRTLKQLGITSGSNITFSREACADVRSLRREQGTQPKDPQIGTRFQPGAPSALAPSPSAFAAAAPGAVLSVGCQVWYNSIHQGGKIPAKVLGYNADGTYQLDVQPRAARDKVEARR